MQTHQPRAVTDYAERLFYLACRDIFFTKQEVAYSQCLLDHLGNTKSDLANEEMQKACSRLHHQHSQSKYASCILEMLPGKGSDMAAQLAITICSWGEDASSSRK